MTLAEVGEAPCETLSNVTCRLLERLEMLADFFGGALDELAVGLDLSLGGLEPLLDALGEIGHALLEGEDLLVELGVGELGAARDRVDPGDGINLENLVFRQNSFFLEF